MSAAAQPQPADLREIMEAYRTCEFATISKQGTPVAWPVVPYLAPDTGQIVVTTCIGLPLKAFNVRRDPRVVLLFSNQTGTGRDDLPQVLVQGTAFCPDVVHTAPGELADYWTQLSERQPMSRMYKSTALTRRWFDWYYMRLVITITPTVVTRRPPLVEPAALSAPRPERQDRSPYAVAARLLPTYRSAVLGLVRDNELPTLQRTGLTADPVRRGFLVGDPGDGSLSAGPASLLLHHHDERLWGLRSLGLLGELSQKPGGWLFTPTRILGAGDGPIAALRALRQISRTADAYLAKRGWARPEIAWDEFKALDRRR